METGNVGKKETEAKHFIFFKQIEAKHWKRNKYVLTYKGYRWVLIKMVRVKMEQKMIS